jgi:hypothetical protein
MKRLIIQIIVWAIVVMLVLSFLALLFVSAQAQPIPQVSMLKSDEIIRV